MNLMLKHYTRTQSTLLLSLQWLKRAAIFPDFQAIMRANVLFYRGWYMLLIAINVQGYILTYDLNLKANF